jgi:SAM-dependent methyltransferase
MFDVIAMSDLIEHVQDPVATLAQAHRLLKPDGLVAIVTPDTGALSRRLLGRRWTHYKLEHLFYFDQASMQRAAARAGFQVRLAKPAVKALTIKYVRDQLHTYRHPVLTPLASVAAALLKPVLERSVRMTIGERLYLLEKRPDRAG